MSSLSLALLVALPALALDVELGDPGTLDGEWAAGIQEGTSESTKNFLAFVGHGAVEQAFTLQHSPVMSSAAWSADGLWAGVQFDSFPLRDPPTNGQGKVENTQYTPAVPRLVVSYAAGRQVRYGAGLSLVPPVSVGGASALLVGGELSAATTVSLPQERGLGLGLELDFTGGQAYAPVVATPEARAAGVLENVDEARYTAVCVPQPHGCVDSLLIRHGGAHLVVAGLGPKGLFVPWFRAGLRLVDGG
ncbi:MAG: hypothetical protein FJ090_22380 [Deltaproteobacteria bacterium]|nr:hypothetical protein [Deltaproteobacteria bacterium]